MNTTRPLFVRQKFLFVALVVLAFAISRLFAATFNIANGDVAGLKAAVTSANDNGQANVINLAAGGTYTLTAIDNILDGTTGLPVIKNVAAGLDLTINGNGATIQRDDDPGALKFRILQIGDAVEVSCNDLGLGSMQIVVR